MTKTPTVQALCRSHRSLMAAEDSLGEAPQGTYDALHAFAVDLAGTLLRMASAAQTAEVDA